MQTVAGNPNSIMYLNNCVGATSKEVGIVRDEVSQCLITDYWQVSLRWFVFLNWILGGMGGTVGGEHLFQFGKFPLCGRC